MKKFEEAYNPKKIIYFPGDFRWQFRISWNDGRGGGSGGGIGRSAFRSGILIIYQSGRPSKKIRKII